MAAADAKAIPHPALTGENSLPPRPSPPGLRARQTRRVHDEILAAGLALLAERGPDGATVEAISQRAGVSTRTFFRYFAAKDTLFTAPFVDLAEHVLAALLDQDDELDAWSALCASALAASTALEAAPDLFRLAAAAASMSSHLLMPGADRLQEIEHQLVAETARRLPPGAGPRTASVVAGSASLAIRVAVTAWINDDVASLSATVSGCLDDVGAGASAICATATTHPPASR